MDPLNPDRESLREERRFRHAEKRIERRLQKLHVETKKSAEKNKIESNQISIVSKETLERKKSLIASPQNVFQPKKVDAPKLCDYIYVSKNKGPIKKSKSKSEDDKTTNILHVRGKRREVVKEKPKSRLKKDLINLMESNDCSSHDHDQFDYCDNPFNEELNILSTTFIKKVVDLQESFFKHNPKKAVLKRRRYVTGFHEIKKYMDINFIKIIIITRDIKVLHENDPLHNNIKNITDMAKEKSIPCIFALKRKLVGKLSLKFRPIGCFGVLDYDGANNEFMALMEEVVKLKPELSRKAYQVHEDISDLFIKLQSTLT